MVGPPGTGKSMLAQRLPGCCRRCRMTEAIATAAVQSLIGAFSPERWGERPLGRPTTPPAASPSSAAARPAPGEISLAQHGVLFLDELPEFPAPL